MKDSLKFKTLTVSIALLCVFAVAYGMASEYLIPDVQGYIQRKLHYERVISKKGLSLHKAQYWREEK